MQIQVRIKMKFKPKCLAYIFNWLKAEVANLKNFDQLKHVTLSKMVSKFRCGLKIDFVK